MGFYLMCLEVHLRIKYCKLLVQTFAIRTQEMIFSKVLLQVVVIAEILRLFTAVTLAIADVTTFMLLSAVSIQFVVPIEPVSTESTFWMALETTLVNGSWVVVSEFLMPLELGKCKEFMFVCEDLFVSRTQIAAQC